MLFLVYSITLHDTYDAHCGLDSSEVAYIDLRVFLDDASRVAEIINYVVNKTDTPVQFSP